VSDDNDNAFKGMADGVAEGVVEICSVSIS
jgi:hypothetical protein